MTLPFPGRINREPMPSPRLLFVVLLSSSLSLDQPEKKRDPLHEFSDSLQNLALRVNRVVVELVSIGYSLGAEEEDATNTAGRRRQRRLRAGIIYADDGYIGPREPGGEVGG